MNKFRGLDGGFGKLPSLQVQNATVRREGGPSFTFQYRSLFSVPLMAFPHFLSTREMAEYVVHHFYWYRRRVAFPPSPLPKDFRALCPSYELTVAEEAAGSFELAELPQVIFYAILLNKGERLAILHERMLRQMESALTELPWSTFDSWVWLYGDQIFETQFRANAEPEEESLRAER